MDPDAALAILRDPTAEPDDRADAAEALLEWLAAGGFPPAGLTVDQAVDEALAVLVPRR